MTKLKGLHLPGRSPAIFLRTAGDGPLVVLLHGIGGNSANWTDQLLALAPGYQAVAWDMRGYGHSDDYPGPLLIDDICADLIAVLDYLRADTAHLIGLSMGGMIAQEFYRRNPDRVTSLLLANTNTGIGVEFSQQEKDEFVMLRKAPLLQGREPADLVPTMLRTLLGETPRKEAVENISESLCALRRESYIKAIEAIVDFDSSDVFADISVPVLLIGSTHDRVIPLRSLEKMNLQLGTSRLHVFTGAGHLSNLERPEEFNDVMLEFLAGSTGGARRGGEARSDR